MFFPLAPDDRNQAPRNAALDEGGACGAAASTSALGGASCEHSVGGGNTSEPRRGEQAWARGPAAVHGAANSQLATVGWDVHVGEISKPGTVWMTV